MSNSDDAERIPAPEPGRSLILFERRKRPRGVCRTQADFLTQLIASEMRIGEFRRARRQEPSAGLQGYRPARPQAAPAFETEI